MPSRQLSYLTTFCGAKLGAGVVAAAALWACSSDSGHPSSAITDTVVPEASTSTKDAQTSADVSTSDVTEREGDADAGESGDATEAAMDEADVPEPPLCLDDGGPVHVDQPTAPASASGACPATIHRAMTTSVSQGVTIRFVGLTPDARTIAWFETGTLNYADRADANSPFSPAHSVDGITPGPDRPALSSDGLRIVAVKPDRHGFTEYVRSDRTQRFGSDPSEAQFSSINAVGVMFGDDQWFGSPVLSSDDRTFVYLRGETTIQRHDAVYASTRTSNVTWPMGTTVHAAELDALCGRYRRPTGLSSDALTLFYWDETVGAERATFRKAGDAPFAGSIDLGDAADGVTNAACNTVYFTASAGGVNSATLAP